ncbi:MAG: hypothetical protein KJ052_04765, partial [Candidatus Hydrogenedentes bacterium]|nr:hypothetical protein [Candidatus Hydrogenedentota bacterium]
MSRTKPMGDGASPSNNIFPQMPHIRKKDPRVVGGRARKYPKITTNAVEDGSGEWGAGPEFIFLPLRQNLWNLSGSGKSPRV